MFTFDRTKFFDGYRQQFGPLHTDLVTAIHTLLDQIEQDNRFGDTPDPLTSRQQLAYCLATFNWETAHTMQPIDELGGADYFNTRYGPGTAVGRQLGNTQAGDGARFHGRGYVQLTGRTNYHRAGDFLTVDLLAAPDRAKDPDLAYRIATEGMIEGWFTGRKLSEYFRKGQPPQWQEARTIINGHDQADKIALIGKQFDDMLAQSVKGATA